MDNITIRVYGLLLSENGELLISNERIRDKRYNKFPGGGLEYGESTVATLVREMKEETGIDINVIQHFYTTDYFVPSEFHTDPMQVMAIYYFIEAKDEAQYERLNLHPNPMEATAKQVFHWKDLEKLSAEDVSLPIDKTVVENILKYVKGPSK